MFRIKLAQLKYLRLYWLSCNRFKTFCKIIPNLNFGAINSTHPPVVINLSYSRGATSFYENQFLNDLIAKKKKKLSVLVPRKEGTIFLKH